MKKDTTKEFELKYCEIHCGQMTNHIGDTCQKCKLPAKETTIEGVIRDFIHEFCNDHNGTVRFLRGIFYDEQDGAEKIIDFLRSALSAQKEALGRNVGMLRQWLNEKDKDRLVTNEDIEFMLGLSDGNKE